MKKIPTLFRRDPDDPRRLLPEVTPGCEWVFAGEGAPTRKFDGTCVMFDGVQWWARREVKPGKPWPDLYQALMTDEATGKTVGWEPIEQSAFAKWHRDALSHYPKGTTFPEGTYELCGPKINGNPERLGAHTLRLHAAADIVLAVVGLPFLGMTYDSLREVLAALGERGIEGVVWHHPDGRMAKLKVRDFARATAERNRTPTSTKGA
jgi:hypothetical protein